MIYFNYVLRFYHLIVLLADDSETLSSDGNNIKSRTTTQILSRKLTLIYQICNTNYRFVWYRTIAICYRPTHNLPQ